MVVVLPVVAGLLLIEMLHAISEAGHPGTLSTGALFWSFCAVVHVHHHHGVESRHWITMGTRLAEGDHTKRYREEAHGCIRWEHEVGGRTVVIVQATVTCTGMLFSSIRYVTLWGFGLWFLSFLVHDDIVGDIIDVVGAVATLWSLYWSLILGWYL